MGRFPRHRFKKKTLVSNPVMHHGTCVTHVPWCMSGSLTRGDGENALRIPGACATRKFTYGHFVAFCCVMLQANPTSISRITSLAHTWLRQWSKNMDEYATCILQNWWYSQKQIHTDTQTQADTDTYTHAAPHHATPRHVTPRHASVSF